MAIKKWNFKIHDNEHEIVMKDGFKTHLTVDGKEISLKDLPVTKENSAKRQPIVIDGETVNLYTKLGVKKLVYNGIDLSSNKPYEPAKTTPLFWIFLVLYVINFLVICGGAVGGAASGGGIAGTLMISNDSSKSMKEKILRCIGLFVLLIVIELIIVALFMRGINFFRK